MFRECGLRLGQWKTLAWVHDGLTNISGSKRFCLHSGRRSAKSNQAWRQLLPRRQSWLHYQLPPSPILPQAPGLTGDGPNARAAALRPALDEKLTLNVRIWRRNLPRRLLSSASSRASEAEALKQNTEEKRIDENG